MMDDEVHFLEIAAEDREAFVLCLALGALAAIRSGAWPLEAAIWTIGRPASLQALAQGGVAADVIAELESADELEALAKFCGRAAADTALDRMIAAVRSQLSAPGNRSWQARWSRGPGPGAPPTAG